GDTAVHISGFVPLTVIDDEVVVPEDFTLPESQRRDIIVEEPHDVGAEQPLEHDVFITADLAGDDVCHAVGAPGEGDCRLPTRMLVECLDGIAQGIDAFGACAAGFTGADESIIVQLNAGVFQELCARLYADPRNNHRCIDFLAIIERRDVAIDFHDFGVEPDINPLTLHLPDEEISHIIFERPVDFLAPVYKGHVHAASDKVLNQFETDVSGTDDDNFIHIMLVDMRFDIVQVLEIVHDECLRDIEQGGQGLRRPARGEDQIVIFLFERIIPADILHGDFLRPAVHTDHFMICLHGDLPFGHAFRRCGDELVPVAHLAADVIRQAAVAETDVAALFIDCYADIRVYPAELCGGGCAAGH